MAGVSLRQSCMKKILVVEDDPLILDFYHDLLIGQGYQVIPAFNGNEALQNLKTNILDLIILDMSLPQIHGRSLLGHIKKLARHVPVIISSGKIGMQDDPEIQLATQVKKFLTKPVTSTILLQSVKQVIHENAHKNLEGRTFANCYLEEFLEAGSSGAVYRARRNKEIVAVKVLATSIEGAKNNTPPREANILCGLRHLNIIKVLAMGTEDNIPFVVMEYFEGESVHKIIQRQGFIALAEAIQILIQICDGMIASHTLHLIHRDLKPSNILYNRKDNIAKIIDFGIAHNLDDNFAYEVIGSPYYMSPEQCQGMVLAPTSDIYSLGVTFFQMITGAVPFARTNTHETMIAHIQEPVEWPAKMCQNIPETIRMLILKMMAKQAQNRHQTMFEVKQDLQNFSQHL